MELSVIIPCHNEAATLADQLDALAGQEWDGRWEIIVVDNRSTDPTAAVARQHAATAGRLRVVSADDGAGVSYARRAGVLASQARSVVFCDGDDVVAGGWVAAMGDALRVHPIVTGEIAVDLLNSPDLAQSRGVRRLGTPPMFGGVPSLRGNNCGMSREVWDELGGFDESFHGLEDIELALRAAAMGLEVRFLPDALVHYRYREGWSAMWRQGLFYGGSYPQLWKRCRELGLEPPSRFGGLRSWAWLVAYAPLTVRRRVRYRWVWTLACRTGAARGAWRHRVLFI